jgi:lipopolysaccharide/colanic/teichoic acid biosynthesis glycosyltransferase
MLLTALAVRLTSRGPVLLRQTRIGLGGRPFQMLKFRTMVASLPDASAGVSGEVTADDERLTPAGAWLRAWRLDELPQLVHVLTGEMSLVGPRPDLPDNLGQYTPDLVLRFAMPPGCTAWTFTRGAFRNDWAARQAINVDYVRRWSLWLDVRILLQSGLVLLSQRDTTPASSATPGSQVSSTGAAR